METLGIQPAHSDIVEEKQWLGAGDNHIIDTHGHQIDADGVMPALKIGNHQLGPYTIRGGYQDRRFQAAPSRLEKSAESAYLPHYLGAHGRLDERPDPADEIIGLVDINTCTFIGDGRHILPHEKTEFRLYITPPFPKGNRDGARNPPVISTALQNPEISPGCRRRIL
jgi:hypothetical protein